MSDQKESGTRALSAKQFNRLPPAQQTALGYLWVQGRLYWRPQRMLWTADPSDYCGPGPRAMAALVKAGHAEVVGRRGSRFARHITEPPKGWTP